MRLSGLPARRRAVNPKPGQGALSAAPGEREQSGIISRRRCCPSVRATGPQMGCKPVARARRVKRRPRDKSAEWNHFPEAMLRICPGYLTHR